MFNWFGNNKALEDSGIFAGFIDFHSHILPGVDDGVTGIAEALAVLDLYESLGVEKVIFTPHIMEYYPTNTASYLRSQFTAFRKVYKGSIELSLGAEYFLDNRFSDILKSGDILSTSKRYILVETAFTNPPINLMDQLKAIHSAEYTPILAHPERYAYMQQADYKRLKEKGILFQLNLLSVVGEYGKTVERKAKDLLYSNAYNCIGTDIHRLDHYAHKIKQARLSFRDIDLLFQLKQENKMLY